MECKPETVWKCVAEAGTLGLEIGVMSSAYLVPFRNRRGGTDCQLIVGYRGMIDLARRSGHIEQVFSRCVYENDEYEVNYADNSIKHVPCLTGDPGAMVFVYAVAKFKEVGFQLEIMTKHQIEGVRKRSKASEDGPWVTDYDEMARKTVVRRLAKYLPLSVEMSRAIEAEDKSSDGDYTFGDVDAETLMEAEGRVVYDAKSGTEELKRKAKASRSRKEATEPAEDIAPEPEIADQPASEQDISDEELQARIDAKRAEVACCPVDACSSYKELWDAMYGERKVPNMVLRAIEVASEKHEVIGNIREFGQIDHTDMDACGYILTDLRRIRDIAKNK